MWLDPSLSTDLHPTFYNLRAAPHLSSTTAFNFTSQQYSVHPTPSLDLLDGEISRRISLCLVLRSTASAPESGK
jgi:hypothetical protein